MSGGAEPMPLRCAGGAPMDSCVSGAVGGASENIFYERTVAVDHAGGEMVIKRIDDFNRQREVCIILPLSDYLHRSKYLSGDDLKVGKDLIERNIDRGRAVTSILRRKEI